MSTYTHGFIILVTVPLFCFERIVRSAFCSPFQLKMGN